MATSQAGVPGRPLRIGWGVGLLSVAAVVLVSTVLPALLVRSLGGGPGAGGTAMFGGFVAGWSAYRGVIRLGVRRGWWA
jgi:hypothetical protein